jgi:hypothetical protein
MSNLFFSYFKLTLTLLSGLLSLPALAQPTEPLETDRPDQTECPFTVPPQWIQVEMGMVKEKSGQKQYHWSIPSVLWKYGAGKKWEWRLITEYSTLIYNNKIVDTFGFHPVHAGFKIQLWEEKKWLPKTSLIAYTGFNKLASKYFSTLAFWAPSFRFTMQNTLSNRTTLGYNIGAEWNDTRTAGTFLYTLAPGYTVNKHWYIYVETFGFIQKNQSAQHNLDGGVAFTVTNNLKLDLSGGIGLSKESAAWYINLGCSFRFLTKFKQLNKCMPVNTIVR